ncbi:MAG TPA: 4Fe-4S double cluster binding domain-containing protein [Anaerovoracaceae bacterium]|nr:4Fe-4S double cluster binding domain-containing protein [Anaerovoracaceae bacterium]
MDKLKEELKQIAEGQMINEIRFIDAEALEPIELFRGRQPKDLMPDAKSLIVAGVYIGGFRLPGEEPDNHGRMSRLTLSGFYWNVVGPLEPLRDHLVSRGFEAIIYDGLSEEGSIPLKPAAVKAGLGWQGKNTLLLNRKYGSFQALGGIVTNADLAEKYPLEEVRCGGCTACISICPGSAIEQHGLNRSKCLSNLLEEDNLPDTVKEMPDNYFFECDICQDACPWNKKHLSDPLKTKLGETFTQKEELLELFRFDSLLSMDEDTYNKKILPLLTGVKLPYQLFRRNVGLAWNYRNKQDHQDHI